MTITYITAHISDEQIGDNATEADCTGYRDWLAAELVKEYPGVAISVTSERKTRCLETDSDEQGEGEELQAFLELAWNRCNWEWVAFI